MLPPRMELTPGAASLVVPWVAVLLAASPGAGGAERAFRGTQLSRFAAHESRLRAPVRATRADSSPILLRDAVEGLLPDSLRTEVLVLGSTHLSRVGERFRPELLDGLIEALEAWGPDAIGVERLPPGFYRSIDAEEEPELGRSLQERLGVGLEGAVSVADSLLQVVRAARSLTPEARLELVRHLVAAHRLPTATLHWSQLPEPARSRADLPAEVREALDRRADGAANETYSIGVRLARERGLSQVHPIDDRTADRIYDLEDAVAAGLRDHLENHPRYVRVQDYIREERRRVSEAMDGGDLLPFFLWKNSGETLRRDVRLQWGIFLELAEETPMAQKRMAHWEVRNLKMVTHIRELTLHHPGGRVLVVVGAGHKAFFDAYLDQMLDVEVVQPEEVLEGRIEEGALPEGERVTLQRTVSAQKP